MNVTYESQNTSQSEIPDSGSTNFTASSPHLLGNLADIFIPKGIASHEKYKNGDHNIDDSQETHLSSEIIEKESEVIPILSTNVFSNDRRSDDQLSENTQSIILEDTEKVDIQLHIAEELVQTRRNLDNQSIRDRSPQQEPKKIASLKHEWNSSYNNIINQLEKVERKITKLSHKLDQTPDGSITELKVSHKDSKIKTKISEIVNINKSEKALLMELKNTGKKIDKERVVGLAKCHRKLVTAVHLQKNLSTKISKFLQRCETQEMDCSQSLLDNSMLTNDSRYLAQSKCLPPSILRNVNNGSTGDIAINTMTQKKTVKFHIPFKENKKSREQENSCTSGNTPDVETETIEITSATKTSSNSNVNMEDLFENSRFVTASVNQKTSVPVSDYNGQTAGNAQANKESALVTLLQQGKEKSDTGFVPLNPMPTPSTKIVGFQQELPMETTCDDNRSIDSVSLISGISFMDAVPFTWKSLPIPVCKPSITTLGQNIIRPVAMPIQAIRPNHHNKVVIGSTSKPAINRSDIGNNFPIVLPTASQQSFQSSSQNVAVEPAATNVELPDLSEMMKRKIIQPGRDVLNYNGQGRIYKSSLLQNGCLQGAGGEIFPSPMIWLKAVTGLKQAPSRTRAYKQVIHNGRSLFDMCRSSGRQSVPEKKHINAAGGLIHGSESILKTPQQPILFASSGLSQTSQIPELRPSTPGYRSTNTSAFSLQTGVNKSNPNAMSKPMPATFTKTPAQERAEKSPTIKNILLVDDDELFRVERLFPKNTWENMDINIPENIDNLFIW